MAEPVSFTIVFVVFLALVGVIIALYRFSNKKLMSRILELKRKNEDLGHVIERLYQARLNDNREIRARIDRLEDKLDALRKPAGREREVALEKVFARRH